MRPLHFPRVPRRQARRIARSSVRLWRTFRKPGGGLAAGVRAHCASRAAPMMALLAGGRAAARGEPKGVSPGPLDRFAVLAGALEQAASAIARFDALATGHPLISAWLWRARLEAVLVTPPATGAIDPGISPR